MGGGGGGIMVPPCNFVAIMIKFGVLTEFDKFFLKSPKSFQKITSLPTYDIIFCFMLPYPLFHAILPYPF